MHPFADLVVPPGRLGIHWFGQSSFALKSPSGAIAQIDPYFPRVRPPEKYIHAAPPLDEATLPTDAVLLTHDHSDHTCIESIIRIHAAFPACRFVGPVESVARMAKAGVAPGAIARIAAGETLRLPSLAVTAFWSKPPQGAAGEGIKPPDVEHLGYVVGIGGMRLYVTGDLINTFADHDELVGPVAATKPDLAIITMHPTEGEFPFFAGAVNLAVKLGVKSAIPAHYQCFVKRTYDPAEWARLLPAGGPRPLIIPYDTSVLYPA